MTNPDIIFRGIPDDRLINALALVRSIQKDYPDHKGVYNSIVYRYSDNVMMIVHRTEKGTIVVSEQDNSSGVE